jgi:UDP-GlcNAc:undecaprenyl-phosphate/decaprenyl-phosphate GlcNAc-1-phosphate transferase
MLTWFGVATAFVAALALTPLTIKVAKKFNIVDIPNQRKVHTLATPRIGGLAIYVAFVLGALALTVYTRQVAALLIAATIVMATGLVDDIRGISPKVKLLGQVIASLVLVQAGFYLKFITNPFDGGIISLGWWGIPLTVIWLTGISNTVNLIDGLDGLSAGVSAIAAFATTIVCIFQGELLAAALAAVLAAAALGFLPWNFHPAKTFMGDTGSLLLGFLLGSLALMGLSKGATVISIFIPFIIMGVPFFDTSFAVIRRLFLKKPIFEADKMHLHHSLLSLGMSHSQTVLIIYALSFVMGLAAVLMAILTSSQAVLVLIVITVITFTGADFLGVLRGKRPAIVSGWKHSRPTV